MQPATALAYFYAAVHVFLYTTHTTHHMHELCGLGMKICRLHFGVCIHHCMRCSTSNGMITPVMFFPRGLDYKDGRPDSQSDLRRTDGQTGLRRTNTQTQTYRCHTYSHTHLATHVNEPPADIKNTQTISTRGAATCYTYKWRHCLHIQLPCMHAAERGSSKARHQHQRSAQAILATSGSKLYHIQ